MRKQSTTVSALILVATLAIPSRSLALTPINSSRITQTSNPQDEAPEAVTMVAAKASTPLGSETVSKAEETSAYPSKEKSAYPESETALVPSSYEKTLVPSNYLPWWRWFTLLPFFGIFIWSILSDRQDYTQYSSDETSAR